MPEQKKNISEFMKYYISGLESCGYCPHPVKSDKFTHSFSDQYVNMVMLPEVYPEESIKCVRITLEGNYPTTREVYEKDLRKQKEFLGPKMAKLSAEQRKSIEDKIAIMNKVCGLQDVQTYVETVEKARKLPNRHKSSANTKATPVKER